MTRLYSVLKRNDDFQIVSYLEGQDSLYGRASWDDVSGWLETREEAEKELKRLMEQKITNHYGVWVISDDPITGVESNNLIFWLGEELGNGIDLSWEQHVNECEECKLGEDCDIADMWEYSGDTLIGNWIKDKDGLWTHDPEGEYAAICGEIYTQVIYSKHTRRCALCSPCFPGQGDIGSIGEFLTYVMPPELVGTELELQGLE